MPTKFSMISLVIATWGEKAFVVIVVVVLVLLSDEANSLHINRKRTFKYVHGYIIC